MFAQLSAVPTPTLRRVALSGLAVRRALPSRPCSAAAGKASASADTIAMPTHLHDPSARDAHYGGGGGGLNVAQYLLDLHGTPGSALNFCGGMMFGLVLSDKLKAHLADVASAGAGDSRQPVVYGAETRRMAQRAGYTQDAAADNAAVFHGREVRKVPDAAGGMGFVIHLSFAGEEKEDKEGWTSEEISEYSGWLSDQQRRWRDGKLLQSEGFESFGAKFGPEAFTLHHRFYLHLDGGGAMWLAAEDGCEGTPAPPPPPTRDYPNARNALSFFK